MTKPPTFGMTPPSRVIREIPVAPYDTTAELLVERLQKLIGADPLTATIRGGGLEEELSIHNAHMRLITRGELEEVVEHLSAFIAHLRRP